MSDNTFVKDALELKEAYDNFQNKSKNFNTKHRELFINLLNRYEKAASKYMTSNIGRIVSFDEYEDFQVEMLGYEGTWLQDIPNHILFNEELLIGIEAQKRKEDEERSRLKKLSSEQKEKETLAILKAKYES